MRATLLWLAMAGAVAAWGCGGGGTSGPTCSDGLKNGTETGVDCGGGCPACADGLGCQAPGDCLSGVCTTGTCAAPTCADGVRNGGETSIDCGGGTCPACATGGTCLVDRDCQSTYCASGACACGERDAIYVSAAGADGGPGSRALPLRTLQAANACGPARPVRVAAGEYTGNMEAGLSTGILLGEGRSFIGGYSPDFTVRDPAAHVSTIRDTTNMSLNPYGWSAAVVVVATSRATSLEGFTIVGTTTGVGSEVATVIFSTSTATATVRDNDITCGGGPGMSFSRCVEVMGGSPAVVGNAIHVGTASGVAWGVQGFSAGSIDVSGNLLDGGGGGGAVTAIDLSGITGAGSRIGANTVRVLSGTSSTKGIVVSGSVPILVDANQVHLAGQAEVALKVRAGAPLVRNNLLVVTGGADGLQDESGAALIDDNTVVADFGAGLRLLMPGSTIRNNLFDQAGGTCILEEDALADPAVVRNNLLFGCGELYRDEGATPLATIAAVNSLAGASGNLSADPLLDPTGHPAATSPAVGAALDLSALFQADLGGAARTVPWCIGAYEVN